MKNDNSINNQALLEYYWNYFELHSNQRIQMINFYITIEIVLFGGLFTLFQLETPIPWIDMVTAGAIVLFSLTFWGLDRRTKELIHNCEATIMALETTFPQGARARLFQSTEDRKKSFHLTYSTWFNLQYLLIGGFGVIVLVLVFLGKI